MKKYINRKAYDTDTATMIAEHETGELTSDLTYACETLYRKRSGEYFLHGEGGAMTVYARNVGFGNTGYGERIIPLTYGQARTWAEEHMSTEAYNAEFGELAEDDGESMLSVRISTTARAKLDRIAAISGRTKSEIVDTLLMSLQIDV